MNSEKIQIEAFARSQTDAYQFVDSRFMNDMQKRIPGKEMM